ncbi:MAG TPA: hypothetical protein VFF40_01815 [Acidimicrobiia bacterium]|nr:hypothetical protein [Acidimicrobiia bacterium]
MEIESRDSVSLKPAELDELGQLLVAAGSLVDDSLLDHHIERFALIATISVDGAFHGFLFGSLERVGGTPCVLWGAGVAKRGRQAGPAVRAMVGELYRRAAISFPDEDVLVAGRISHASGYSLLTVLDDVVPRGGYKPTGEERAWGRRLARRFGCDANYDQHAFRVAANGASPAILNTTHVKGGTKAATALFADVDVEKGESLIAFGWAGADKLVADLATYGRPE